LAKYAGTQEEAVVIPEVETFLAEDTMLRRLAHVSLTSLAMPKFVGRVMRWWLRTAKLLVLALLLGDYAAQVALYLLDLHWI